MRVLVTGGAGYVGSVSVETLVGAGHRVVVLDDLSKGHAAAVPPDARLVVGSYGDGEVVAELLREESIDAVLHCAARSLVAESVAEPSLYYRQNVVGGIALLEAMREAGVARLVFSSTAAVYGVPEWTPIAEDALIQPISPYGETKRTFESALAWYSKAYGLRAAILRYFNVAGASDRNGEVHRPETHLIPNVLIAAETGRPMTLFGDDYPTPDGTPIRDYIDVADLADAHLRALEAVAADGSETPGKENTEDGGGAEGALSEGPLICNLGNGAGFSNREVVAAAERVAGHEIPVRIGPRRAGDPPILVATSERARRLLGWRPRRAELDAIVGSAWDWRRRHPQGYPETAG